MDKQQIEEMANFFKSILPIKAMADWIPIKIIHNYKGYAEELYNAGYRKIAEGSVVLRREEYEQIYGTVKAHGELLKDLQEAKSVFEKEMEEAQKEFVKQFEEREKEVRKETAEKFAERVKMAFYYEFDELIPSIMADKIDEICKEISEGKV